jgi:nucleotide-binding universal stress UspA family protein
LTVIPSASLSPLSDEKRTLEQVEAVFTDAVEQPGILVRVGDSPAAEICQEARTRSYDLLALGMHDQAQHAGRTIGSTCRYILENCPLPLFITPPGIHPGATAQVLIVLDDVLIGSPMLHWIASQCQAQKLNAILYADSAQQGEQVSAELAAAGVRSQQVIHGHLSPAEIVDLGQDRRVRWVVVPPTLSPEASNAEPFLYTLLRVIPCPVLALRTPQS